MTIAGTILYAILEIVLKLLLEGALWLANAILDESIVTFSANEDFFTKIMNLLAFKGRGVSLTTLTHSSDTVAPIYNMESSIGQIIRGIAYGVVILLVIFAIFKSILAPATGDDAENPLQVVLRGLITIILMLAIFGFNFGDASGFNYNGLITSVGQWFSTILSSIGETADVNVFASKDSLAGIFNDINPVSYLASAVLYAAILTTVFGAAITYIERLLSFALYVLMGPVAVAMYASSETSDTFKQWVIGILTQFLAVFISLIMWKVFIAQVNYAVTKSFSTQIFELAIALGLLNLMKDSEKILNAFGLRTMSQGSCARSLVAGAGALVSGVMMGMQATRAYNMAEKTYSGGGAGGTGGSGLPEGVQNPFDSNGQISDKFSLFKNADGKISAQNIRGLVHTPHPIQRIKNAYAQKKGVSDLLKKVNTGEQITGADINKAMGWTGNNAKLQASGKFEPIMSGKQGVAGSIQPSGFKGTVLDTTFEKTTPVDNAIITSNKTYMETPSFSQETSNAQETAIPDNAGSNLDQPTSSQTIVGKSTMMPEDDF